MARVKNKLNAWIVLLFLDKRERYYVDIHLNFLHEAILIANYKICFYGKMRKTSDSDKGGFCEVLVVKVRQSCWVFPVYYFRGELVVHVFVLDKLTVIQMDVVKYTLQRTR